VLSAGDTVWLTVGTYNGPFTVNIDSGKAGQPIVFRQRRGDIAKIVQNGGFGDQTTATLTVSSRSAYTEYWDFEVLNSSTASRSTSTPTDTSHELVPNSVWNVASHTKFVNLIIHDGGQAIQNDPSAGDVLISGCIIYNNGWERTNPANPNESKTDGHGLYLRHNSTADSLIATDNIIFNQFGYGIHAFVNGGTGYLNNIRLSGNISFDNGSLSQFGTSANLGNLGDPAAIGMTIDGNMLYFADSSTLNITQSYIVTAARNLAYGSASNSIRRHNYIVDGNPFSDGGSGWTIPTPGDSDLTSSTPWSGTNTVIVRRTLGDRNRANVVIYHGSGAPTSAAVALDTLVSINDSFVVSNAQNFRSIVTGGRYTGPVTLQLSDTGPPTPLGWTPRHPVKTSPNFDVFVATRVPVPPPLSTPTITGPTQMNSGQTCHFYASSTGGFPPITYTWAFSGGSIVGYSPQNGVFLAAAEGSSGTTDLVVTARDSIGTQKQSDVHVTIDNWTSHSCN
jgi:hypothetical protein